MTLLNSPKRSIRLNNKRLAKLNLKNDANTDTPSVSAALNGDPNAISNLESSSNIKATINSAYSTEDSAQARESRDVDIDNLDVSELARLVEEARLIEEKNNLKRELRSIYQRINNNNTTNDRGHDLIKNNSHTVGEISLQRSFKNKIMENCELFQKLDVVRDPAVELRFFEDRCTAYGITSDIEKFEILQRIWPRPDILDFVEAYDEERTYFNLYKFLQGKGSKLPCILGANPSWQGPVKFQNLYLSAKKWAKSKEEDRIKYFMYVHAPKNLKNKIKECFGLDYDEFIRRTELLCDIEQQRVFERAKKFSYEPQRFKYNKRYPNKQKWLNNIPHKREHFRCYKHNRSQGYSWEGYNRRTVYDQNVLCHKHANFGDKADYCAAVETCSMSPLKQQYDQKNEFPSSKQ